MVTDTSDERMAEIREKAESRQVPFPLGKKDIRDLLAKVAELEERNAKLTEKNNKLLLGSEAAPVAELRGRIAELEASKRDALMRIDGLSNENRILQQEAGAARLLAQKGQRIAELEAGRKADGAIYCEIMATAIAAISDAAIVKHATYDGRYVLAAVRKVAERIAKLRGVIQEVRQMWFSEPRDHRIGLALKQESEAR